MLSLLIYFLLFVAIFAVLFAIGFEIYKKFNHEWKLYMKFHGPEPMFFFGNVFQVPATKEGMFRADLDRARRYPEIYRFPMLHIKSVMCFNADDIEHLISGHGTTVKSFIYDYLMPWLGTGLLTSEGEKWQSRRKILTPAFHFNILQGFLKVFNKETQDLVNILHRHCHEDYIDVVPYISDFTLNSINETAMGISAQEAEGGRIYKNGIFELGKLIIDRLMRPWFYNEYTYKLNPAHWKEKKWVKIIHGFTNNVIRKREETFELTETEILKDASYSKRKKLAMLDLLLSEKQKGTIDFDGISEEVNTFMFEGHDTVSLGICFSLLVLANYKSVQEKIREEFYDVMGDKEIPDYEDLNNMKYMERCIKEVLRLYPSVPNIFRTVIKEGMSKSGRVFPVDTLVLIEMYNLHRDPKHFPDPETFDPDRFLPENCKGRHPFAYIPFSAGPRNCIGQRFALLEMKAVLFGILQNFDLEPVHRREDVVLKVDIVLRPNDDGIRVKFVPRKKTV